jgi:hypothetical protein
MPQIHIIIIIYIWKLGELQERPIIRLICSLSYYEGYNVNSLYSNKPVQRLMSELLQQ